MINLNADKFKNKIAISKAIILHHVSDIDIYTHYFPNFALHRRFKSPFREDKQPSFGFYISSNNNGEIYYNDFAKGGGDFVDFVSKLRRVSYSTALSIIGRDFGLDAKYKCVETNVVISKATLRVGIDAVVSRTEAKRTVAIKSKKWTEEYYRFWKRYGITMATLRLYNVVPISHFFIGDNIFTADKTAYAFKEVKDGHVTYKIYQPYSAKNKWYSSHNTSVWQGWTQLPETGDVLLITKSLKDVMSIRDTLNVPAVSLQAESSIPKPQIIEELSRRFEHIGILYDNDYDKETNWGQVQARKLITKYDNLRNVYIYKKYESKDYSDLVLNKGVEVAKDYLTNKISVVKCPF